MQPEFSNLLWLINFKSMFHFSIERSYTFFGPSIGLVFSRPIKFDVARGGGGGGSGVFQILNLHPPFALCLPF